MMFQEEQVRRGMALLDERVTGWDRQLNLTTLDINSYFSCVLGQLYGSYMRGMRMLDLTNEEGVGHGFVVPVMLSPVLDYDEGVMAEGIRQGDELDKTWKALVSSRQAQQLSKREEARA